MVKEGQSKNKFVEVDLDSLHHELRLQAKRVWKYASQLADAKHDLRLMEVELELIDAELDLAIRDDPAKFNLPKLTEPAIKKVILTNNDHRQMTKRVNLAKHKVDVLTGALKALDHKKSGLQDLVVLWCQDYWAEPRIRDKDAREAISTLQKRSIRNRAKGGEDD